jgi:hypothetical protein
MVIRIGGGGGGCGLGSFARARARRAGAGPAEPRAHGWCRVVENRRRHGELENLISCGNHETLRGWQAAPRRAISSSDQHSQRRA